MQKVLVKVQWTNKRRQHQPAQVNAPVDTTPHASTVAESNNKVTNETEIQHDLEEDLESHLAKKNLASPPSEDPDTEGIEKDAWMDYLLKDATSILYIKA